jgi:membrane associated rhomboid family serine protease
MKVFWQQFSAALTPGVRILLLLLTVVYLSALAGTLTRTVDLQHWLAASAPDVWRGQIWRIVTYALLPAGIMDFVMNAFALVLLGSRFERHWSRRELWLFCGIAAAGAGVANVLLAGAGSPPLTGAAPMMVGLLIAWAFISGHEVVLLPLLGQSTVRQLVLVLAAVSILVMLFSAGLTAALVLASGALAGWIYLRLRQKWLMTRASRAVHSERIQRLEL